MYGTATSGYAVTFNQTFFVCVSYRRVDMNCHRIVIKTDNQPAGQQMRRFNAQTIDEIAIIVVSENVENRNIILHRHSNKLQRVSETHRS